MTAKNEPELPPIDPVVFSWDLAKAARDGTLTSSKAKYGVIFWRAFLDSEAAPYPAPDEQPRPNETLPEVLWNVADTLGRHETPTTEQAQRALVVLGDFLRALGARLDAAAAPVLESRFDFVGSLLGTFERTPVGGVKVPARITRVGVLQYRLPDGSVRRELRPRDEVFKADSLKTLIGASVTDLEHHRGLLDPKTWKDAALGHAENIRADDKFVAADLHINDADTIAAIEARELRDISCGYQCRLDFTPGVYEGEPYDVVQRDIQYNHIAVLPPGKGRAGADVALRLDGCTEPYASDASPERASMSKSSTDHHLRIDTAYARPVPGGITTLSETEQKTALDAATKRHNEGAARAAVRQSYHSKQLAKAARTDAQESQRLRDAEARALERQRNAWKKPLGKFGRP